MHLVECMTLSVVCVVLNQSIWCTHAENARACTHKHSVMHICTRNTGILKRELKFVDMTTFLPTKNLKPDNIMELCRYVFERDTKVKQELRKGVWMHLVGVYHPNLKSRRDREDYIERLRRVYDSLKGINYTHSTACVDVLTIR